MSEAVSQEITRRSASNLALAFILLPRPRRRAMSALYAFCRQVDDVADDDTLPSGLRQGRLEEWRQDLLAACDGGQPKFSVAQELQPIIRKYHLPFALFEEIIRGCETDLERRRYPDWADLELYCYRVASAVGLLSIEIFGYRQPACRDYAIALGKAFQLTNILRDVQEDAARDRIYLPESELERFQVSAEEILQGRYSERYRALAASVAARARALYREARELLPAEDRRAMVAAELMGAVYWRLLQVLEQRGFDVFAPARVRLGKWTKLALVARTWWRFRLGSFTPGYGNG